MRKVAIVGAGARARLACDIFELNGIEIQGYISSEPNGTLINGRPVLCSIEEFREVYKQLDVENIFIGVGDNVFRQKVVNIFKDLEVVYINCIHPKSEIASDVQLGQGVYIDQHVIIQNSVRIGDHTHFGVRSIASHDSVIGDFCNIALSSVLCGKVNVNTLSVIGPNATVLEKRSVGAQSIVAAGSVVTKDIGEKIVVGGLPAKYIKQRDLAKSYLK